ncbi:HAMP domain-containing sensor histidine kinase [Methylocapsa acidiphila]|uniref:HAMP domain-containing sensor histidine kinase n=1 Tax=Methylocapsa acidiphila TaxID=133552 RepID=UPI000687CEB0|nr:ATP-binding protein [Methylocapsa acidiphila]
MAQRNEGEPVELQIDERPRGSLFGKYAFAFVGLVLFVLTISGAIDAWVTYRNAKTTMLQSQGDKAEAAARRIEHFVLELERQIGWAARAGDESRERRRADYALLLEINPAIARIVQIDGAGLEILSVSRTTAVVDSGDNWSLTDAFRNAQKDVAWFGPVIASQTGTRLQMSMASAGEDAGVVVAEIELAFLTDVLNGVQSDHNVSAYITATDGKLIAHTDPSLKPLETNMSALPQVAALVTSDAAIDVGFNLDQDAVLAAAAKNARMNWLLFVEQPLAAAYGPVYDLLVRLSWLYTLGLVLCAGAAMLLARRMTVPIKALQAGAARLAAGDFSQEIIVRTGDEIETLADEFNDMARELRANYARIEQKVEERTRDLAQSVRELKALEEIGLALASSLELKELLATILTRAVELTEADGGAIYSFDQEGGTFRLAEAHGFEPSFVATLRDETGVSRIDGLLGAAARGGEAVQILEISEAPGFPSQTAALAAGFRSALIVPLTGSEGALGALLIQSRTPGRFAAEKIGLIQTFAHQSVLAMHNARLYHAAEDTSRKLALANEHQSRFFANMSHELRTPLSAILGYAELLRDGLYGALPEGATRALDSVSANGAHLLGLIDDVLDLAKLEAGELSLDLGDYSMRNLVEQVAATAYSLARAKGLSITADIDEVLPVGRGDERRLTQVLLNLVSNAIKFTEAGGVTIRAHARGEYFELAVEDTGVGISLEEQARIFDAFHQGDNASTRRRGGVGLGLSISKRFVEMHGGAIKVFSTVGVGSTFMIALPIRVETQKAPP